MLSLNCFKVLVFFFFVPDSPFLPVFLLYSVFLVSCLPNVIGLICHLQKRTKAATYFSSLLQTGEVVPEGPSAKGKLCNEQNIFMISDVKR